MTKELTKERAKVMNWFWHMKIRGLIHEPHRMWSNRDPLGLSSSIGESSQRDHAGFFVRRVQTPSTFR